MAVYKWVVVRGLCILLRKVFVIWETLRLEGLITVYTVLSLLVSSFGILRGGWMRTLEGLEVEG